ncbi:MAG: YebG family protein [Gammaproteobacteria bacterium]
MPAVTEYVVEHNGVEKMTSSSKTEADQYDKPRDTAESLEHIMHRSILSIRHLFPSDQRLYL